MDVWKDLSTREMQAYGALCLHRFCKAKGIAHASIDKLIDHLLLILITYELADWERQGAILELNGRWDPIPATLNTQLKDEVREDFARLVEYVVDIGFSDMYGAASRRPLRDLVRCLVILDAHGVERPDVNELFKDRTPRGKDTPAWGDTLTQEQYEQVKSLFR